MSPSLKLLRRYTVCPGPDYLLGQWSVLQSEVSEGLPAHARPWWAGVGLLQSLLLPLLPPPHVLLQVAQAVQLPQLPWTEN